MSQYLLNIYQPDGQTPPPEALQKVMRDVEAYINEARSKGVFVFTARLHPASAATVVRFNGHEAMITDGPFAEGKEHIGGFLVINVPDLDGALEWARKLSRVLTTDPARGGLSIEVRPFVQS